MPEDSKELLQLYCEEWRVTNQYVNDIDKGYGTFLTICTVVGGGAVTLLSAIGQDSIAAYFFYIIPICFLEVFAYLAYQFRITAILRGHLACLEDKINEIAGDKIFMWNSILTDAYMAHNNGANKFHMVPILLFVIVTMAICIKQTFTLTGCLWLNIVYWCVLGLCSIIELIVFFRNETIRKETRDKEKVLKKYQKLIEENGRKRHIEIKISFF